MILPSVFFVVAVFCLVMMVRVDSLMMQVLCAFWAVLTTVIVATLLREDAAKHKQSTTSNRQGGEG
jgi:archaellum biogenesis protein FlaJ (TadC family)